MLEQLLNYTISLYKDVPASVYEGLVALLCVGSIVILCVWGVRRGWRNVGLLMLAEYVFLLFGLTVIFRPSSGAISGYNFQPFWSYKAISDGRYDLVAEILMNALVFVPVGLLIGTQIAQKIQKGWLVAIAVGAGLSVGIETLQFVFKKGFSEVDDVMHNTLGCIIGFGLYKVIMCLYKVVGSTVRS